MPKLQIRAPTSETLDCDLGKEEEREAELCWDLAATSQGQGHTNWEWMGGNNGNMLGRKREKGKALTSSEGHKLTAANWGGTSVLPAPPHTQISLCEHPRM